jgi:hypothetical protein
MNYKQPSERLLIWTNAFGDERTYLSIDGDSYSLNREYLDTETGQWANDDFFEFGICEIGPLSAAINQLAVRTSKGANISGLKEPI